MKAIHVVLAAEVLAIALLIYRARAPGPTQPLRLSGARTIRESDVRRTTRKGPQPTGTVGAATYRTDGARTLY